jgi:hypothetical protein
MLAVQPRGSWLVTMRIIGGWGYYEIISDALHFVGTRIGLVCACRNSLAVCAVDLVTMRFGMGNEWAPQAQILRR